MAILYLLLQVTVLAVDLLDLLDWLRLDEVRTDAYLR